MLSTTKSKTLRRLNRKINLRKKEFSLHFKNLDKKIKKIILMNWTYPKKILLGLFIILMIGACLLYNPAAYNYSSYEYVDNHFVFTFTKEINKSNTLNINFIDAIFLSASAFTNSGFTVIDFGNHLSGFGQFIVFALIELGGFGWASFFYLIGKAITKVTKKNVFSSAILNIERGGTKITQSATMIVRIFFVIISIQIFFAIILSILFYSLPFYEQQNINLWNDVNSISNNANNIGYSLSVDSSIPYFTYQNYGSSLWAGIFMSASSLNNAGIDLFGSNSLEIFRNDNGIAIQFIIMILFSLGAIGFPVIYDLHMRMAWNWNYYVMYKWLKKKSFSFGDKPKFSSFSKICLSTSLIALVIVTSLVYVSEYVTPITNHDPTKGSISIKDYPNVLYDKFGNIYYPFGKNPDLNKNFSIFFNAVSTRATACFSTVNIQNLSEATIWLFIISIFIGASPSSTGGGIRVTTIAILSKSIAGVLRGVNKVSLFKRNIPTKNIIYAFVVLIVSLALIIVVSLIMFLTVDEIPDFKDSYTYFIFESVSAFGTSGLSSGIIFTPSFGWWNTLLLILLMFIGQMGMFTALTTFARKVPKKKESNYLKEYVKIA